METGMICDIGFTTEIHGPLKGLVGSQRNTKEHSQGLAQLIRSPALRKMASLDEILQMLSYLYHI